ncbi:hypothetical protein BS78_08G014200 [Paspalum vaginatum]|nr:hypothetical protein BS78_08G014200 [Paspalum vaginatum]
MPMSGLAALLAACLLFALLLSEAPVEAVKVTATPIFHQIPRDQASRDFQVLVRVQAPPPEAADHRGRARVPIDLAVALNVGPARLESVKAAVKFIIWQLHEDDRVAIVGPSSSSNSQDDTAASFLNLSDADARVYAGNRVDSLVQARDVETGYTQSALEAAVKMVMAEDDDEVAAASSLPRRASFVILVTDTAAEDSSMFSNLPVVIHTIGLGAAHDPEELHRIAEESHGTYSFVDDENMDGIGIAGAVAVCLSGLNNVVSVGARLLLNADVASGARITSVQSGGYEHKTTAALSSSGSGEVSIIDVGVLYAREVKSFIVHLDVPAVLPFTPTWASLDGCCDSQRLLNASFVDHHYYHSTSLSVQRPPPQQQAAAAAAIGVTTTTQQQQVPSPLVVNHIAQFQVLAMVSTLVEQILLHNSVIAQVAGGFQTQWEDFMQVHQFWTGLDFAVLQMEINRIVIRLHQAAAMHPDPEAAASSLAYVLSWLSSYAMQRPTAMGSSSDVSATFITLDVQLLLQQVVVMTTPTACIGCLPCKACVDLLPAPVLEADGDGTYHIRAPAYQAQAAIWVDAINLAMNQMYLAMVQANDLKQCDDPRGGFVVERQTGTGSASTHRPY